MAIPNSRDDLAEERLIEQYIDLNTDQYPGGRAEARLHASGVSVWAIVAYLPVYDFDLDRVAWHFGLSREEVDAALAYYARNKRFIDARIALNEA